MVSRLELGRFCNMEELGRIQRKAKEDRRERIKSLDTLHELVIKSDYKII